MRSPLLLLPLLLAFGCAEPPEDVDDDASEPHRTTQAWALLERVQGEGPSDGDASDDVRTNFAAKFVRVAEGDVDSARQLIGVRPALPGVGECVPMSALELPAASPRAGFSAELVDVGEVRVEVRGNEAASAASLQLVPRAFPDIGDLVSGVFYTSPDVEVGLPLPAPFEISAQRADRSDTLTILVDAPAPPEGVMAGGEPVDGEPTVALGKDLTLAWAVSADASDATIYVDVRGKSAHRCAFRDGGAAIIPHELFAGEDVGKPVTVALHRLSEKSGRVHAGAEDMGVDAATIVFDLSRSFHVSVAAPESR